MLVRLPRPQADAVLGAMKAIALEHGAGAVTDTDRAAIASAATIVLGLDGETPFDALAPVTPQQLAAATLDADGAAQAVRFLAIMSVVDGVVDPEKTAHVQAYADALGVHEDYLTILTEVAASEIVQAAACIMRKNVASFPRLDHAKWRDGAVAAFFPYRDAEQPELAARYETLGELPEGTFGRAFFDHFQRNGFAFPGHADGLAEGFTTPHDSSHVLSSYSTSQAGEICVSTFIGGMHPDHPMAAEILPVLYSWHLGVQITPVAGHFEGAFEPRRFWTAWDRGHATTVDVVADDWDFWGATEVDLEELRRAYGVPPVDPALVA